MHPLNGALPEPYRKIVEEKYGNHVSIYTDGSRADSGDGAAGVNILLKQLLCLVSHPSFLPRCMQLAWHLILYP